MREKVMLMHQDKEFIYGVILAHDLLTRERFEGGEWPKEWVFFDGY